MARNVARHMSGSQGAVLWGGFCLPLIGSGAQTQIAMWTESMTTETILVCLSKFPIFEHGLLTRLVGLVVNFVQVAATESPYLLMISSKFIFSQIQY